MRGLMIVALALIIGLIGVGTFVLTVNALTTTNQANTTTTTTQPLVVTTNQSTTQDSVQPLTASSVQYGVDAESEITASPQFQGHSCGSGD